MALQFTGKNQNSYELIKPGEYEFVLKMSWDKTLNGARYISCVYTIREDVAQEFQGRLIFDGIYADENGVYDQKRIDAILSTIENPKLDFEDYDEVIQYLNGKLLKGEVSIVKANPEKNTTDRNKIKTWTLKPTAYPDYTMKIETAQGFAVYQNQTVITDEDLPF